MTVLHELALTLNAATLTGGALIAAASANPTLPRRITTEDYTVDMAALPNGTAALGLDFTSDSLGVVVSWSGSGYIARIDFKTATVVWATTVSSVHGVQRTGTAINLGRTVNNTTWYQFDEATGAQTTRVKPTGVHRQVLSVPGGTADRAWIHAGSTTVTEIVISTGAATGRTLTSAGNISSMWVSNGDGTPKLYVQNATDLRSYKESDQTLVDTWTIGGIPGSPGGNVGTEMYVSQATGRPYIRHVNGSLVDRYPTGGGAMATLAVRAIWPGMEIGGMAQAISTTAVFPFMSISPDGKYLAFLQPSADQSLRDRILRVINIQTQRASWATVLGVAGTLVRIPSPGMGANEYGSVPGWRTLSVVDHQRTKFFYQRTGGVSNDAARVQFTPNTSMSVPLEAAHTITVDADMDVWLKPFSAKPWIGGDRDRDGAGLGEGPSILYAVADTNVIPTVTVVNKMIELPTTSESLTAVAADADGTISTYAWTNVSGPNVATLAGTTTATVTASGLIAGEYVLQCVVTDSSGGTATAQARIFVAAGSVTQYVPSGGGSFRGRLAAQPAFRGRLGTR